MKRILFSFFLFTSLFSFSQDLKCSDFKTGKFIAYSDNPDVSYKITRTENYQTEELMKAPKELINQIPKNFFIILEWKNDCSYLARFDESKAIDDISKSINNEGGVLIEKTKIKGNCFYYKGTLKVGEELIISTGRFCKESN